MFGILVGTLNKAKIEDKERNASEAVSKLFFWPRIFPKKKKPLMGNRRRKNDNWLNRDYKLSFEKRMIPSGAPKRLKRTRRLQTGKKKNYNLRTRLYVTIFPFLNDTNYWTIETQYKLRRQRLPILANFLLTSDVISSDDLPTSPSTNPLAPIPRSHPPPLCYLPVILTPAQEAFISRRKSEVLLWNSLGYLFSDIGYFI